MTGIDQPPRGILRPRPDGGHFTHARRAPSPALAPWIEHYWHVAWDLRKRPPQNQQTLPHPNVHLVAEVGHSGIYGVYTGRFTRLVEARAQAHFIGDFRQLIGHAPRDYRRSHIAQPASG